MKPRLLFFIFLLTAFIPLTSQTIIFDFETDSTTGNFQFFGSSLEAQLSQVVDNPSAMDPNTSAKVVEFKKPAGAQVWAGGFADPSQPVVLGDNSQFCLKVYMDHIGSVTIKLESGLNGAANWERTIENTKVNEWEEICFDMNLPSAANPFAPATGNTYTRVTLFTDFGTSPATDQIYYLDDFIVQGGGVSEDKSVTFNVNMNGYDGGFDNVYVRGTFNDFSDANPLMDNGDGTWSATLLLPAGNYEYLFYLSGADEFESLPPTAACVKNTYTETEVFTNRSILLTEDIVLDTVAFNSCYPLGASAKITFQLGSSNVAIAESGLYLAGGADFGVPGGPFRLLDEDEDGIYELTIERQIGFSGFYSFANGNCPDFSCKEDLSGQDCANPDNFNDRFLESVMGDTTITSCFGTCVQNTTCIASSVRQIEVNHQFIQVTPNLVSDELNLQFAQSLREATFIQIYDVTGKLFQQMKVGTGTQQYRHSVLQWPKGLYVIHLQTEDFIATQRFVKQ